MSAYTRAAFVASLTFVLAQFALPERASTADGGAGGVTEPVQLHNAPHPATYGARTCLPDRATDHTVEAPFAAAQSLRHTDSPVSAPAPEPLWSGIGAGASVLLPPSRAPPAHS